jgi:hypothetical protein
MVVYYMANVRKANSKPAEGKIKELPDTCDSDQAALPLNRNSGALRQPHPYQRVPCMH